MALERVTAAIRELTKNDISKLDQVKAIKEKQDLFVTEGYMISSDVNVTVDWIGKLKFPLEEETITQILKIASKTDKFHVKGHTPHIIPASMLTVEIKEDSLRTVMSRLGVQLNIDPRWTLFPKLDSLMIYEPGQFYLGHTDADKEGNTIAKMMVALPMFNKDRNKISAQEDLDVVKYVMFRLDCYHNLEEMMGSAVVLAYNVEPGPNNLTTHTEVNRELSVSVAQHFADNNHITKLIYLLDHSYTELDLKWSSMKESDERSAFALLAVAKAQGLTACLGLIDYEEQWDMYPRRLKTQLYHLAYVIDEHNNEFPQEDLDYEEMLSLHDKYSNSFEHYYFKNNSFLNKVDDEEVCYSTETRGRFSYKSITRSSWGAEETVTEDLWYRRSCVLLFVDK